MIRVFTSFLVLSFLSAAFAEDWGTYQIVPVSAPDFVLEVVGDSKEGDIVSINKPSNAANQKWIIQPRGDGFRRSFPATTTSSASSTAATG
ncbi:MAG: RICIN domain-containing protein [Verrucomicrobiaceae bacterium]|nr:RICIN domain-containing protein [Verrucomicrobiaceae bacterium]